MRQSYLSTTILVCTAAALTLATSCAAVQPQLAFFRRSGAAAGDGSANWGTANDGEKVTVSFQKQAVSTVARNGKWMVKLQPLRAGGPFTMKINSVEIKNILVGEVWLCSGQSNMEWGVLGCKQRGRVDGGIRGFDAPPVSPSKSIVSKKTAGNSARYRLAGPAPIAPDRSPRSAIIFGKYLRQSLKVPVGMVEAAYGGTWAEVWTSRDALLSPPGVAPSAR